jgi:hypothetical protein
MASPRTRASFAARSRDRFWFWRGLILAVLSIAEIPDATEKIDGYCRQFHQECVDAQSQGFRDAGICKVERLECSSRPASDPHDSVSGKTRRAVDSLPGR